MAWPNLSPRKKWAGCTGYWWAPDDSKIAFAQFDESGVAEVLRNEIYASEIKLYNQRYPYAGAANVKIRLGGGAGCRWGCQLG